MPAIEIVDDRYQHWQTLGAPTLVADDFFAAGCVLGKPVARSAAPDMLARHRPRARSTALKPGRAAAPTCSAILTTHSPGSPTISPPAASTSRAGEIVLTGSLVKTVWLAAGDQVRMELRELGNVDVAFS